MTIEDEPDISQMLELRRRHMREQQRLETLEQRWQRFAELQAASFKLLRSSPEGYENFLRRNHKSRRVEVIDGVWHAVSPDRPSPEA